MCSWSRVSCSTAVGWGARIWVRGARNAAHTSDLVDPGRRRSAARGTPPQRDHRRLVADAQLVSIDPTSSCFGGSPLRKCSAAGARAASEAVAGPPGTARSEAGESLLARHAPTAATHHRRRLSRESQRSRTPFPLRPILGNREALLCGHVLSTPRTAWPLCNVEIRGRRPPWGRCTPRSRRLPRRPRPGSW